MFTKQCAAELGRYGITVNAIAPTFIETDMNRAVLERDNYRARLESRIPWAASAGRTTFWGWCSSWPRTLHRLSAGRSSIWTAA